MTPTLRLQRSAGTRARNSEQRSLRAAIRTLVDPRSAAQQPDWSFRALSAVDLLPVDGRWPAAFCLKEKGHYRLHLVTGDSDFHWLRDGGMVTAVAEYLHTRPTHRAVALGPVLFSRLAGNAQGRGAGSAVWAWPVWSGERLVAFWVGTAGPEGDADVVDRLEEFNYWLSVAWELQAETSRHVSGVATTDAPLARWLNVDSLQTLCARVYPDFHAAFNITRLLIVTHADHPHTDWALCPSDHDLVALVDRVFSSASSRVSALALDPGLPCSLRSQRIVQPHALLREAGLDRGALVDTDHNTAYCVFWGTGHGRDISPLRDGVAPDLVQSDPLWRQFEAALNNMAHLEHLRELSHIDSTTGVYNRRHFNMRLIEEVARARRFGRPLSLTVLDVDHFKHLNDTFGHQAGDAILQRTAEHARCTVRSIDVFCRLGGDEFAVLMPDAGPGDCLRFGQRLRTCLADHRLDFGSTMPETRITVSIGGAVFPDHADQHERLLWCADMALLEAKQKGRNRFILYDVVSCRAGHVQTTLRSDADATP